MDEKTWNHGSADCSANRDAAIETFRFDAATYVLRQNKCVHFEAPVIYVLLGEHTAFVQDTGATADPERFPLFDVVKRLLAQHGGSRLRLLVAHSHSHSDHTAGDPQFRGKPGVTLVEPDSAAVREHFGFSSWPSGTATIDLGGRKLVVIPTPGHQEDGLAVYDPRTRWLLTGDNLYPGQLYVGDWNAYRRSIQRLAEFSAANPISAVMGTHIEMSRRPGDLFPRGSTFQPDEAGLALAPEDLLRLDVLLRSAGAEPQSLATEKFVVTPVPAFLRVLSSFLKWIGIR